MKVNFSHTVVNFKVRKEEIKIRVASKKRQEREVVPYEIVRVPVLFKGVGGGIIGK